MTGRGVSKVSGVVSAMVSLSVVLLLVLVACDNKSKDPGTDAGVPFDPGTPNWTVGHTLYTPDASYDLGTDVLAFVRTSVGIVFVAEDDEKVYSFTGEGEPERVGDTFFGGTMLVSDPHSPYVGWYQRFGGDGKSVVLNQRTGRRVLVAPGGLVAIDGKDVYLRRGLGRIRVLREGQPGADPVDSRVVAAKGGIRAFNADTGMVVGTTFADGLELDAATDPTTAVFSPDGAWVSTGDDDLEVFDVRTGERQSLEQDEFDHAVGHEWLDDDTLLAVGIEADISSMGLLSCEVPEGRCSPLVAEDIDFENGPLIAFADGRSLWASFN